MLHVAYVDCERAGHILLAAKQLIRMDSIVCDHCLLAFAVWPLNQLHVWFSTNQKEHITPLLIKLRWLPLLARIKFKALVLVFRAIDGSAPIYIDSFLKP